MRARFILHTLRKIARLWSGRSLKRGPAGENLPASHIRLPAFVPRPQATSFGRSTALAGRSVRPPGPRRMPPNPVERPPDSPRGDPTELCRARETWVLTHHNRSQAYHQPHGRSHVTRPTLTELPHSLWTNGRPWTVLRHVPRRTAGLARQHHSSRTTIRTRCGPTQLSSRRRHPLPQVRGDERVPAADEEPAGVVLAEAAGLLLGAEKGRLTWSDALQAPFSAHN